MHYLDIISILILLAFFFLGVKRGFILSLLQLVGIVLIFVLIRQFGALLRTGIHERLGVSETVATIIGYILIFIIVMVFAKIMSSAIKKFMKFIRLGWMDGLLGGFLGLLFGFIVVVLIIMLLEVSSLGKGLGETRRESVIYNSASIISEELIMNIRYRTSVRNTAPEQIISVKNHN